MAVGNPYEPRTGRRPVVAGPKPVSTELNSIMALWHPSPLGEIAQARCRYLCYPDNIGGPSIAANSIIIANRLSGSCKSSWVTAVIFRNR